MSAKVALVTGGAKRVGRAIVDALADAGFDIAFTFNSSLPDATALMMDLTSKGRNALAIQSDLTIPEKAAAEIFDTFRTRFSRLDVLVNSASLYLPGRLRDTNMETMRKVAAIHVQSPLLLCQKF